MDCNGHRSQRAQLTNLALLTPVEVGCTLC